MFQIFRKATALTHALQFTDNSGKAYTETTVVFYVFVY